jgi:hypothetical protein
MESVGFEPFDKVGLVNLIQQLFIIHTKQT